MNDLLPPVSRRSLFRTAVGSVAGLPFAAASIPLRDTAFVDAPPVSIGGVPLRRTKEKRDLSRQRYRNSEEFSGGIAREADGDRSIQLYTTGITIQLALSSYLFEFWLR